MGIVSSGLIARRSEAAEQLLRLDYDCVVLDEAHRARRRNINRPFEHAQPNNLLAFIQQIALQTRSLLLATATPIQIHPIEAWDLLEVLARGNESVLGNAFSPWRNPQRALELITGQAAVPTDVTEMWEWVRNPLPPREEHRDFEILRNRLAVSDVNAVADGDRLIRLGEPELSRIRRNFQTYIELHNPLIRRLVRRTRAQLEAQIDPETKQPLLRPIQVRLFGEGTKEAIPLSPYLSAAYALAEEFCRLFGARRKGSGFLETLLLRRLGSSIYAGKCTIERILNIQTDNEDEEDEPGEEEQAEPSRLAELIDERERSLLSELLGVLRSHQERDPKYTMVRDYLLERGWLRERGCIIFSQYRDSIQWLAQQLTVDLPDEPIALYSGLQTSGIMQGGVWKPTAREAIKQRVAGGQIRLMVGTDSASEGLNLQKLGSLINLDLPWNPTRLEQRKGRIQRIGQIHDTVYVYNMRYRDSVEDRVHELLSERLENIYTVFGQLPDVLEDAWVAVAQGAQDRARQIIDAVPQRHPFELRYTSVEKVAWEQCAEVLDERVKRIRLRQGW